MRKIITWIIIFFAITNSSFAWYKMEQWSVDLTQKYSFNTKSLDKPITRKEFVETLHSWFIDYKKDRGVNIDYLNYKVIDNSEYFKDIDLESDFWKKVSYFAWLGAFSKREYFDATGALNQRDFFTVMKRLKVMFSLQNCKYHRICEREADDKTFFLKWTYYKYVSKILDRKLRKYYSKPNEYLAAWYKPLLNTHYNFPLKWQTLNGCYAFSVRNILKYKDGIGIYIPKAEKLIGKAPKKLWTFPIMKKFDEVSHVEVDRYYYLDTLIHSLQAGDPVAITYYLDYYSWKERKNKKVLHIVAAYSFDSNWVWVAETVTNRRVMVPWEKVFNRYWTLSNRRMFKYNYQPKDTWTEEELSYERENNILVWEY